MSREEFLLMACIQSCLGKWGLNMPVDILRGSRAKKILDAQYDKLPLHGLGKDYSANRWKALAYQLISSECRGHESAMLPTGHPQSSTPSSLSYALQGGGDWEIDGNWRVPLCILAICWVHCSQYNVRLLTTKDYLVETVSDIYRTVRVSQKGEQFLSSAGPDHQPPLMLPVTSEMLDDEDNKSTSGEVGEINSLPILECDGVGGEATVSLTS